MHEPYIEYDKNPIKSFEELHFCFQGFGLSVYNAIFRGLSKPQWKLVPKFARYPYSTTPFQNYFNEWKKQAIRFIDIQPKNQYEWLALAQHHGLPTPLLDWTKNPIVACFFAVAYQFEEKINIIGDERGAAYPENKRKKLEAEIEVKKIDAVIWAFCPKYDIEDINKKENNRLVQLYEPSSITPRIVAQNGVFTYHHTNPLSAGPGWDFCPQACRFPQGRGIAIPLSFSSAS